MLVALQIKGRWDGTKYVFDSPSVSKVYKGPIAYAKGGGGTVQQFTPTGPWTEQIPYIQGLFSRAENYLQNGPPQYYPGSTVASYDQTPLQQNWQDTQRLTGNNNAWLNSAVGNAGMEAIYGQSQAGRVGQGQVTPYNTAINQLLSASVNNPTQSVAQSALPAFYSGLGQASQGAAPVTAPTTQFGNVNANPALMQSMYSNGMNPFTGQIVDAALRSQNQQFAQNVLPQISSQANMVGQLGGTRHGIVEGIATQQHQALQKDAVAQLFGQAFDVGSQERLTALGLAGQGQQTNAASMMDAQRLMEQQRQGTMQSGLNMSQIVGQLLGQGQQLGTQAAGQAGQLTGNMIQTGSAQDIQNRIQSMALMPGLSQAVNQNLGTANQTGMQQYGLDQAGIDAAVERWFYDQYAPYNMLTQYQNWITGPYGASQDWSQYGLDNWLSNILRGGR